MIHLRLWILGACSLLSLALAVVGWVLATNWGMGQWLMAGALLLAWLSGAMAGAAYKT